MKRTFKREKSRWYIDLPLWPGPKSALEMVCGANDLLNRLSNNSNEVTVMFSTKPDFEYDDILIRVKKMSELDGFGMFDGAVYEVDKKPIKNEFLDNTPNTLWLCGVTLFVFLRYPKKIYFRAIK